MKSLYGPQAVGDPRKAAECPGASVPDGENLCSQVLDFATRHAVFKIKLHVSLRRCMSGCDFLWLESQDIMELLVVQWIIHGATKARLIQTPLMNYLNSRLKSERCSASEPAREARGDQPR